MTRAWKKCRCPSADEWIKKLWYMHTMECYSAIKKECIWVHSNEVDKTRAYYTEWRKSEREKQILYINAFMEYRKMVLMNLCTEQWWKRRQSEGTCGDSAGGEGGTDWESSIVTQAASGNLLHDSGSASPVLCDSLEGWDGVGGGRGDREGGDICIPMTDSCWCMAETKTIL